jgi:hypothetical protein
MTFQVYQKLIEGKRAVLIVSLEGVQIGVYFVVEKEHFFD